MKNILVVCADKDLRKDLSKALASALKCLYVDIDEFLDYELLNSQDISLEEAHGELRKLEQKSILRASELKDCVMTISHDLFVSNDNFKLINTKKVFIFLSKAYFVARFSKDDKHKLEQELTLFDGITKLISTNCDLVIEKGAKSIDELCKEIIEHLKQSKAS